MTDRADRVRRAYRAFAERDFDTITELSDPDVEFTSLTMESEGVVYRGRDGLREYFDRLLGVLPDWRPELEEVEEHGDRVLARARHFRAAQLWPTPMLNLPVRLALLIILALVGAWALSMTAVTAEGERAPATAGPGIEVLRDRPYDGPGGPTLDAYLHRAAKRPRPALLVVHGGAWAADDKRSMAPVAAAAARRGLAVFNVNYTLAQPGSPGFPRQYAELRAAVRWIRANADRLNVDPRRVGALGTSAGGHLVALLAGVGRGPLDRGARIRAAVTWSGPFELGSLGGWLGLAVHNFVGCLAIDCSGRITAASPVAHASPDDPPMLIFNSREELIPADQARSLAERLTDAGVPHRLQLLKGDLHGRAYASVVLRHSVRFIVSHLTP